jgi:hypothetical protein
VLKQCVERGLLPSGQIKVRVKQEACRYSADTCSLSAKLSLK